MAEGRNSAFEEALRQHTEFSQIPHLELLIPPGLCSFGAVAALENPASKGWALCGFFKQKNTPVKKLLIRKAALEQKEGSLQEKKIDDPFDFPGSEMGLNLNEKILGTCYLE